MNKHVTVVYYPKEGYDVEAFHVINADENKLKEAFNRHDITMIKCIFTETHGIGSHYVSTAFTEIEIVDFLNKWNIDY